MVIPEDGDENDQDIMKNFEKLFMKIWTDQMMFATIRAPAPNNASNNSSMIPHIVRVCMYQSSQLSLEDVELLIEKWMLTKSGPMGKLLAFLKKAIEDDE